MDIREEEFQPPGKLTSDFVSAGFTGSDGNLHVFASAAWAVILTASRPLGNPLNKRNQVFQSFNLWQLSTNLLQRLCPIHRAAIQELVCITDRVTVFLKQAGTT
jgi:hypothetical protein